MEAFELAQLIAQRAAGDKLYLEFLNVPDLSMGLYVLPVGGIDPQSPHTEAEVYYVVSGRAQINRLGGEECGAQIPFDRGELDGAGFLRARGVFESVGQGGFLPGIDL